MGRKMDAGFHLQVCWLFIFFFFFSLQTVIPDWLTFPANRRLSAGWEKRAWLGLYRSRVALSLLLSFTFIPARWLMSHSDRRANFRCNFLSGRKQLRSGSGPPSAAI